MTKGRKSGPPSVAASNDPQESALKGRNLISLALQRQVGGPPIPFPP